MNDCSKLPTNLRYVTDTRVSTAIFNAEVISKVIQHLNQNKAHGRDGMSTRMLEICDDTIGDNIQTSRSHCHVFHQNERKVVLPLFIKN